MKNEFNFEEYAKYCKKEGLEVDNPASMEKYKEHLEKLLRSAKNDEEVAKQKEVFDTIARYCGVKVKYDERAFEFIDRTLESMLFAIDMANTLEQTANHLSKTLNKYDA